MKEEKEKWLAEQKEYQEKVKKRKIMFIIFGEKHEKSIRSKKSHKTPETSN